MAGAMPVPHQLISIGTLKEDTSRIIVKHYALSLSPKVTGQQFMFVLKSEIGGDEIVHRHPQILQSNISPTASSVPSISFCLCPLISFCHTLPFQLDWSLLGKRRMISQIHSGFLSTNSKASPSDCHQVHCLQET